MHETVPWEKDRHLIKVKGSNKLYCIIGVDLPFYLLSELIIRGNDIAIAPSHEIRHSQDLEQLSSHEKALLTGEVKPKVMPIIQQELQLMDMNRNFVELSSNNLSKEQRENLSDIQEYKQGDYVLYQGELFVIDSVVAQTDRTDSLGEYHQYGDVKYEACSMHSCEWTTALRRGEQVYLYHTELEKIRTEDIDYYVTRAEKDEPTFTDLIREVEKNKLPKHEIATTRLSPTEKLLTKIAELVNGLLDSIKSVFKQQQKNDEALINTGVLQAIYAYVGGFLPCPTDTRDKLAVFVSEYKKINSEDEKGRVINKIGDTVKTIHYELERDKSDIEKVNKIIDSMIEYIRLVNESDKSNVNTKLELEHDYMKKLLEDTRNAKRVAQGDTKSFEDIVKEDGFNIK